MQQKKQNQWLAIGLTAFSVIGASILLYFFVSRFSTISKVLGDISMILRPIFYGLVLAFLLLPVHRSLMRWQRRIIPQKYLERPWAQGAMNAIAVAFSLIFAGLVVYVLLAMLVPQLYISIVGLVNEIPQYIIEIQSWISNFLKDNPEIQGVVIQYYAMVADSIYDWLKVDLMPNLASLASTIAWLKDVIVMNLSGVVSNVYGVLLATLLVIKDIFIGTIVAIYLLIRKDIFAAQAKKMVYSACPTQMADFIIKEVRGAYKIMSGFINGKLLDSLIIGILSLICCNLLTFPYPVLLATIIGVTNIIPFFGPFIGAIPCALLILLVSPLQCLYFVIFILVLQQFDGNILGPKILGDSTGLASFWVLFSIIFFGGLFGFVGMVMGVPVFAMIYSLINQLVRYGLTKRNLPVETEDYMGQTEPFALDSKKDI